MSNYTKTTNFGAKDTLPSGDSQKIVRGSEFDTEFNAISTAIATKLESGSSSADVNFLQSGTGATTRTVQSKLRDVVSVKDFGAVGDGVTDDSAAINAAIAAAEVNGGEVFAPEGVYLCGSPIALSNGKAGLQGVGQGTVFKANSLAVLIDISDGIGQNYRGCKIGNFLIGGTATIGVSVDNAQQVNISNIGVSDASGTNFSTVFYFANTWGGKFENLSTAHNQTQPTYCFKIGPDFNANHCSNWYTSNNQCAYNVYMSNGTGAGGHGNTFDALTIQGGRYGLVIEGGYRAMTFNSLYCENVVFPITLGKSGAAGSGFPTTYSAYSLVFNGATILGPVNTRPDYADRVASVDLYYAWKVQFNGCHFGSTSLWVARYTRCHDVAFNNCYTSFGASLSSDVADYIVKSASYYGGSGVTCMSSGLAANFTTQLLVKSDGYSDYHYQARIRRGTGVLVKDGNKCGTVTLSSGTASVLFGTAETDTSYRINLSGNAAETFYWSSTSTSGFTINSSNASSTATVNWSIQRDGPDWAFEAVSFATSDTHP